jgi:hypothetical protein
MRINCERNAENMHEFIEHAEKQVARLKHFALNPTIARPEHHQLPSVNPSQCTQNLPTTSSGEDVSSPMSVIALADELVLDAQETT